MSLTPETFEQELRSRLGSGHRLRWSSLTNRWLIEQQTERGSFDDPLNDWDDSAIRARDGYTLVCSVYPVPYMICPECRAQLGLPHLSIGEVICAHCTEKTGQRVSYFGGYFPLCERLLARLERTSYRRAREWRRELDETNSRTASRREQDSNDQFADEVGDHYNRFMDRPQIGYGGSIKSTGDWTTS